MIMNKTALQYIISITLFLMTGILLGNMYPIGRALLTGLFFATLTAALVFTPDDNDD